MVYLVTKCQLNNICFYFRQEALSSAVSEKDAHLAWLEVTMTGEGNVHTMGTIDRLRKERRELLQRMKDEVCRDLVKKNFQCKEKIEKMDN